MTATTEKTSYGIDQILEVIENLSHSQGYYARLLENINYAKDNDPNSYENIVAMLESQNFTDPVDIVMFFEGQVSVEQYTSQVGVYD